VTASDVLLPLQMAYLLAPRIAKHMTVKRNTASLLFTLLVALAVSMSISIILAMLSGSSVAVNDWFDILKVVRYFAAFVIAYSVSDAKHAAARLSNVFLACAAFSGLLGWGQVLGLPLARKLVPFYHTGHDLERALAMTKGRATGTVWNPNIFGSFLNLAIAVTLGRLLERTSRRTTLRFLLDAAVLLFLVLTLLQTASRTNLVVLVVLSTTVLGIHFFQGQRRFQVRRPNKLNSLVRGALAVVVVSGIILFIGQFTTREFAWRRITQVTTDLEMVSTLNYRMDSWLDAWAAISGSLSSFLFGRGPGLLYNFAVDSEYLVVWLQFGLFGLMIYLSLMVSLWKLVARLSAGYRTGSGRALMLTLSGMLVTWGVSAIAGPFYAIVPLMTTLMVFAGLGCRMEEETHYDV
jgi:hypothetical protein